MGEFSIGRFLSYVGLGLGSLFSTSGRASKPIRMPRNVNDVTRSSTNNRIREEARIPTGVSGAKLARKAHQGKVTLRKGW